MRLAYYPGCSADSTAIEFRISTQRTAALLGIDLWEIPDWNCCGASSAHAVDRLLAVALPARNLAMAEKEGLDILAPCAACYNRFRAAEHEVRKSARNRAIIEKTIEMEYRGDNSTISILELLVDRYGLEQLQSRVTNPLKGMRPACYYGCLLVRPSEITGFDDPEYPRSMDRIMEALGAAPVDWNGRSECCGASLSVSKPDIGLPLIYDLLKKAAEMGADSIVTACPVCMSNLDMRQKAIEKRFKVKLNLPVYYITELVAIACGDKPNMVGLNRHFVEASSLIESLSAKVQDLDEVTLPSHPCC
ncbi:MAG: CoB--CoM heterodisulfide reductase iron-sulfur subunit B family protein [Chitinophagales bacterium]